MVRDMDRTEVKTISDKIVANIAKVIVGRDKEIKLILAGCLAGGHILIEDKPGTGKTLLAKAFAKSIEGSFKRVQFTPDLMPSDVTGINIYDKEKSQFHFVRGPVFTNILLADEINRAAPRTQSSLLEAMEEKQVTVDGTTYLLEEPFMVIATQNPVETTGTYPLPAAQLDRFMMKIMLGDNDRNAEMKIIDRFIEENPYDTITPVCTVNDIADMKTAIKKITVHESIREYMVNIIFETRDNSKISVGASTRALLSFVRCAQAYAAITGKTYVTPDITRLVAPYVLNHRVTKVGRGKAENDILLLKEIVDSVKVPIEDWEQ